MEVIEGNRLADSIRDKLCDHLYCRDCSMLLDDGGCKVEAWLDSAPSIQTKQIKYYDEDEKVWKIGSVIVDE